MSTATMVLVTAHLATTLVLTGMIWTVQLVHYPLMALVGIDRFPAYEAAHAPRMASVVVLPWTIQGLTTAALLLAPPVGVPSPLICGAAIAAVIPVAVTVGASVPAHRRLATGFDAAAHRRLVATNWLRTLAWTAHSGIAMGILRSAIRAG
jgi:hypothetical protein